MSLEKLLETCQGWGPARDPHTSPSPGASCSGPRHEPTPVDGPWPGPPTTTPGAGAPAPLLPHGPAWGKVLGGLRVPSLTVPGWCPLVCL